MNTRFGGGTLIALEKHWVGRARVATLHTFGQLIVITAVLALILAIFKPALFVLLWGVFPTLGVSIALCFPFYLTLAAAGLFVQSPGGDEGPGFNSDTSR